MTKRQFRSGAEPDGGPAYPTADAFEPRRRALLIQLGAACLGVGLALAQDAAAAPDDRRKKGDEKKKKKSKKNQEKRPPPRHPSGIAPPTPAPLDEK